jgi:hypothetical protein
MDSPGDAVGTKQARIALDGLGEIADRRVVSGDQGAQFAA